MLKQYRIALDGNDIRFSKMALMQIEIRFVEMHTTLLARKCKMPYKPRILQYFCGNNGAMNFNVGKYKQANEINEALWCFY